MLNDTDLLNHIHQTTEMGQRGIDMVMDYVESASLRDALQQQRTEYGSIYRTADTMLRSRNVQPEKLNAFAKLSTEISSSMQTMADHSESKIAEMMIQGNTKGMTKSIQCLNDYSGTSTEVKSLAQKLLKTEEANIKQMKAFL